MGHLPEWMPLLREMLSDYGQFGAMLLVDIERRAEPTAEHPIIAAA